MTSKWRTSAGVLALLAPLSCGEQPTGVTLRSLEASGRTSVVCLEVSGSDEDYEPRDLSECWQPGYELALGRGLEVRHPFALVTQTTRGEVAVVNLNGTVVDLEPTSPGFGFLVVGANPVDIVSTPGSVASFVGVAEVGREGIFAIPSTCLRPRQPDEPVRDITSWPACRLPSAPGDMAVLVDPPDDAGLVRAACDSSPDDPESAAEPEAATREICPADLRLELNPPGRRKLVVALPDRQELVVIDAQELLDRTPGSYEPCAIERQVPLRVDLPTVPPRQELPADLDETCRPAPVPRLEERYRPRPAGFALVQDRRVDENRLYVGDLEAPVVHVLDVRDPCSIEEEAPLLPASFFEPGRVVTTRNIAVSPLTSERKRFLYAVDYRDRGSIMVFDVSPGSANRTPLLRAGYPLLPFEPPDRIRFDAPVQDLTFAYRDRLQVSSDTGNTAEDTGNLAEGVLCDPDPALDAEDPGARYRPSTDFSSGAAPGLLRGVFAFAALDNGEISVVDVDDFDRKCRRPVATNPSAGLDFRGCSSDELEGPLRSDPADPSSRPTVTAESSCRTVQPHRIRSRYFLRSDPDFGTFAPALRARPRLVSETGRTLIADQSEAGRPQPRLLGVNFSEDDLAQVNEGTRLLQATDNPQPGPDELDINPATAAEASVVLSLAEPRAYFANERFVATYEGVVVGTRPSADFRRDGETAILTDSAIGFCDLGIEDEELAANRGVRLAAPSDRIAAFGRRHADYVTINSELPARSDAYWDGVGEDVCSYLACRSAFGTAQAPTERRELRVVEAYSGRLVVEPRRAGHAAESSRLKGLLDCCFPAQISYNVRASAEWVVQGSATGFRHAITTDQTGRCVRDTCGPRAAEAEGRVIEVSCAPSPGSCPEDAEGFPAIGPAVEGEDIACIVDDAAPSGLRSTSVQTLGKSGCIYRGLTSRFVIYRGLSPSRRDMQWSWDVQGGFVRLSLSTASAGDPNAVPESIWYSQELDRLVVTDGATKGLFLMSLSPFGSFRQYF